jgi:hypothetical protein
MELRTFPTDVHAYILDSLKSMVLDCARTDNTDVLTIYTEGYFMVVEIMPTHLPGSFTVKVGSIFTNIEIHGSAFTDQIRLERTSNGPGSGFGWFELFLLPYWKS